ncbi:MAG: Smr/MutS family protein [Hydrogenophilus sp.]|nr:Smr/MutS family protein [Hydrogenophilus sp.]
MSSRPSPPLLSETDLHLWHRWLHDHGVRPLPSSQRLYLEPPPPAPLPRKRLEDETAIREQLLAPITLDDWLEHDSETQFLRPGVPRRVLTDLRRGRWVIRRQIDLHGLTRTEARAALLRFLATTLRDGERCVRIIHGKGLRSPGGIGILKHLSRQWLTRRPEILAFCEAPPHQGGSGALLVFLCSPSVR